MNDFCSGTHVDTWRVGFWISAPMAFLGMIRDAADQLEARKRKRRHRSNQPEVADEVAWGVNVGFLDPDADPPRVGKEMVVTLGGRDFELTTGGAWYECALHCGDWIVQIGTQAMRRPEAPVGGVRFEFVSFLEGGTVGEVERHDLEVVGEYAAAELVAVCGAELGVSEGLLSVAGISSAEFFGVGVGAEQLLLWWRRLELGCKVGRLDAVRSQMACGASANAPQVLVTFRAAKLHEGWRVAIREFREWMAGMGIVEERNLNSRLDPFCDLASDEPSRHWFERDQYVTRAVRERQHWDGERTVRLTQVGPGLWSERAAGEELAVAFLEGRADRVASDQDLVRFKQGRHWTGDAIGSRGADGCQLRIYDKVLHEKVFQLAHVEPWWRSLGWNGDEGVRRGALNVGIDEKGEVVTERKLRGTIWRVEFELGREKLWRLGYATVEDLERQGVGPLWSYLTREWFRVVEHFDRPPDGLGVEVDAQGRKVLVVENADGSVPGGEDRHQYVDSQGRLRTREKGVQRRESRECVAFWRRVQECEAAEAVIPIKAVLPRSHGDALLKQAAGTLHARGAGTGQTAEQAEEMFAELAALHAEGVNKKARLRTVSQEAMEPLDVTRIRALIGVQKALYAAGVSPVCVGDAARLLPFLSGTSANEGPGVPGPTSGNMWLGMSRGVQKGQAARLPGDDEEEPWIGASEGIPGAASVLGEAPF